MPKSQKGAVPFILLITVLGLLAFIFISSILPFKNKLFNALYPKPPSYASTLPVVFKSSSGEILPTNASGIPLTTSAKIKIELVSTLGPQVPSATPSSALTPEATDSATASAVSQNEGTAFYRIGESPSDLDNADFTPYIREPMVFEYTFKNNSSGSKLIWVDFKDFNDKTDRKVAQIELIGNPPAPTPTPTLIPTPLPTPLPAPPLTPVPTPLPAPRRSTPVPLPAPGFRPANDLPVKIYNRLEITPFPVPTPVLENKSCGIFCRIESGFVKVIENLLKLTGLLKS